MQEYQIEVEGISAYMQRRMDDVKLEDWEKQRGVIIEREDVAKEDLVRAEFHMYRNKKGQPYIPSEHFKGSFIDAGGLLKSKVGNKKKSMKNIVAAMFKVLPNEIILSENWIIDKRSVNNKSIHGRVICVRPKWEKWSAKFSLFIDNDTITEQTVRSIIENAGNYIGIGSFRPTNNGEFGRYKLIKLKKNS